MLDQAMMNKCGGPHQRNQRDGVQGRLDRVGLISLVPPLLPPLLGHDEQVRGRKR